MAAVAVTLLDPEAEAPQPRGDWRYTARPEWSTAGESMWMRLAKFSLCNRLSVKALATLFAADADTTVDVDLRCADRWNAEALASVLEISADDVRAGFCVGLSRKAPAAASPQLRGCRACLVAGFHAAWFQWKLVRRCPLHDQPLRLGCVRCTAPIPYTLGPHLAAYPLSCASCGCAWVPTLSRPAGRCTPLPRQDGRLLRRWSLYVGHVVGDDGHRTRKRRLDGTLLPSVREHPLRQVNRLFDAPPPLTVQLLRRRRPQRRQSLDPAGAASTSRAYDRPGWPHFDRDFALCEHVVHDARRQLFVAVHDACERGRWRHLLGTELVVPAETMDRDTAAALGWSMAWTGCLQTLAPELGGSMPAFGLAGWLAGLPLRPSSMPRHRWHSQVLRWLGEDLVSSAWIWRCIAGFMRARGVYLLHAALASPAELARLRCQAADASVNFT